MKQVLTVAHRLFPLYVGKCYACPAFQCAAVLCAGYTVTTGVVKQVRTVAHRLLPEYIEKCSAVNLHAPH